MIVVVEDNAIVVGDNVELVILLDPAMEECQRHGLHPASQAPVRRNWTLEALGMARQAKPLMVGDDDDDLAIRRGLLAFWDSGAAITIRTWQFHGNHLDDFGKCLLFTRFLNLDC